MVHCQRGENRKIFRKWDAWKQNWLTQNWTLPFIQCTSAHVCTHVNTHTQLTWPKPHWTLIIYLVFLMFYPSGIIFWFSKLHQFSSGAQSYLTFCDPMNHSMQDLPVHHQLLEFTKLMSIKSVMPSSHLILCCPLLLLPLIPLRIRVFSNESTLLMKWPKYWSFTFSISPSNEHPGLIYFRMDWLDLLAARGLSRVFSNTTDQKHQFFGTQLSSPSNSHIHTWPLEKP